MRILLIDTSAVLHSVKYSLGKHKLSHKEKPTFVIYGFLLKLQFLMTKINPDTIVFALDNKGSKRKEIFPEYKEKRNKNKNEKQIELDKISYPQFNLIQNKVLKKLGYRNIFSEHGYEADDIIASISKQYGASRKNEIIIVSNDGDLYQLLRDNVCMFNPKTNQYYSKEDFKKDYGIPPKIWKRVKAIGGCTSDEVPGVPIPQPDPNKKQRCVAEKGALNYILGKTNPNTKAHQAIKSKEGKKVIKRNKKLVVLPFEGTPKYNLLPNHPSAKGLKFVCKKLGFKSILSDFENWKKSLRMY